MLERNEKFAKGYDPNESPMRTRKSILQELIHAHVSLRANASIAT